MKRCTVLELNEEGQSIVWRWTLEEPDLVSIVDSKGKSIATTAGQESARVPERCSAANGR
jgi:hypothetical protein